MSAQPRRRQSGNIPALAKVVGAPAVHQRALDILVCDRGSDHDVRMEWELVGGIRTGQLVAWCWTCRRRVIAKPHTPPADAPSYACRQEYFRNFQRQYQRKQRKEGDGPDANAQVA